MDIKEALLQEHSKIQTKRITDFIKDDPDRFKILMSLFLGNDYRTTQRAAWSVSNVALEHPELVAPFQQQMLDKLKTPGEHDAVKRNILRIWVQHMPPEDLWGDLYDQCYRFARSKDEAGAIRAFSIYVLGNIAAAYPELAHEVISLIEDLKHMGTAAILSSSRKVLKQLNKR